MILNPKLERLNERTSGDSFRLAKGRSGGNVPKLRCIRKEEGSF
jgi:hypothetical protein